MSDLRLLWHRLTVDTLSPAATTAVGVGPGVALIGNANPGTLRAITELRSRGWRIGRSAVRGFVVAGLIIIQS
jgi:hypothetical protein